MMVLLALSLAQAVPAMAAEGPMGRLCKSEITTGSIVPTIVCKPYVQWREEMRTDDPDQVDLVADYAVRRLNSWED